MHGENAKKQNKKKQNRLWPWWDNSALSCCSYQTSSALARAHKQRYCNARNWGCPSDLPTKASVTLKTILLLKMKHLSASVYMYTQCKTEQHFRYKHMCIFMHTHAQAHDMGGGGFWTLKLLKCQLLTPTGWKMTLNSGHTFQSSFLFWLSRDSFTQHCRCSGWVTLKYKMFWKRSNPDSRILQQVVFKIQLRIKKTKKKIVWDLVAYGRVYTNPKVWIGLMFWVLFFRVSDSGIKALTHNGLSAFLTATAACQIAYDKRTRLPWLNRPCFQ